MSDLNFAVNTWVVVIVTILRLSAGWDYLHIVKRAAEEADAQNGLEKLRKRILWGSWIMLFLDLGSLTVLIIKPFASPFFYYLFINFFVLINAIAFKIDGILKRKMWNEQYTIEQKQFHQMISRMEKRKEAAKLKKGGE